MGKKGFYYLRKSFQFFKKKSTLLRGKKKRIKIKHNLSKIGSEGKKASLNSQSNHCSWGALPGLGKPSSKNLSWVRRKGGGTEKKSHPRSSHWQTRWCSSFCFWAETQCKKYETFLKKKIQWKMPQKLQLTKTRKAENQPWAHVRGTMVNMNTEQTQQSYPWLKKKYLPKFQYTLSYWKYYMCMFSLEYGWQWYSEKARTE